MKTDAEFREVLNASPAAIGGESFRAWVRDACVELGEKAARPEDVSLRRQRLFVDKSIVIEVTSQCLDVQPSDLSEKRRHSALRPIAARMLVKYAGLTHRQVADTLGMKSGVSASLQVRRALVLKDGGGKGAELIAAIETVLDQKISEIGAA